MWSLYHLSSKPFPRFHVRPLQTLNPKLWDQLRQQLRRRQGQRQEPPNITHKETRKMNGFDANPEFLGEYWTVLGGVGRDYYSDRKWLNDGQFPAHGGLQDVDSECFDGTILDQNPTLLINEPNLPSGTVLWHMGNSKFYLGENANIILKQRVCDYFKWKRCVCWSKIRLWLLN